MENIKNNIILIILNIIEIVCLFIIINNKNLQDEVLDTHKKNYSIAINTDTKEKESKELITIDIKGAVKKPGVYTLEYGSIINDAINASGGVNKNANLNYLNLSKKLKNEMVIHIYTDSEIKKLKSKEVVNVEQNIEKEVCVCEKEIINVCEGSSIIETPSTSNNTLVEDNTNITVDEKSNTVTNNTNENIKEELPKDNKISINTATKEELMTISGIGESKAKQIIEYRTSNGLFQSIEDIKNVSGIGDSLFAKIKDYITI